MANTRKSTRTTSGAQPNAPAAPNTSNTQLATTSKPKSQPTPRSPTPETEAPTLSTDTPRAQFLNPFPRFPDSERPAPLLFVWGAGNDGQFGTGPSEEELYTERRTPFRSRWFEEQVAIGTFGDEPGAGIEAIAAGGLHTMFVDENGTIWSCGNNDEAALGRQTADVPDDKNPGKFIDEPQLTSYFNPIKSLVDEGFRAVKIAAGDNISGAINALGDLRVWGSFRANEGVLGFSPDQRHQALPAEILTYPRKVSSYEKAAALAAGTNHLLVLTTYGNIYTWGAGDSAQLGRRVMERRKIHGTIPEKVVLGNRARKAVAIASGSYHSFAIDTNGDVWSWGSNHLGQTGTGRLSAGDDEVRSPKKVKGLSKAELGGTPVVEIAGGEHHSLFLTSDGRVFACGRAYNGQLGLREHDPAIVNRLDKDCLPEPALVGFPDKDDPIVHVSAGMHNSMAVSRDGALYAWGQGLNGELGAGEDEEIRTPKMVVRRSGGSWKVMEVACGGQHTVGLFMRKS